MLVKKKGNNQIKKYPFSQKLQEKKRIGMGSVIGKEKIELDDARKNLNKKL